MNPPDIEISVHPYTRSLLEMSVYHGGFSALPTQCMGFQLVHDYRLVPYGIEEAKWIFPEDPFVIYEPSDEEWARYLGFGKEQPAKIQRGEIKLKRDLPIHRFTNNTHPANIRFPSLNEGPNWIGHQDFSDPDYVNACRAVERIDEMILRFLNQKLRTTPR